MQRNEERAKNNLQWTFAIQIQVESQVLRSFLAFVALTRGKVVPLPKTLTLFHDQTLLFSLVFATLFEGGE